MRTCNLFESGIGKEYEISYDSVQLTSTINKILYIHKLEEVFQIDFLNVELEGKRKKENKQRRGLYSELKRKSPRT